MGEQVRAGGTDGQEAAESQAKLQKLQRERAADQAQMRETEQRLQAALQRSTELSEANSRLGAEKKALEEKVAQLSTPGAGGTNGQDAAETQSSLQKLQRERAADQAQMRETEQRLQAALQRSSELSEAHSRLGAEKEALAEKVAQLSTLGPENQRLVAEVGELSSRLNEATSRSSQEGLGERSQPSSHSASSSSGAAASEATPVPQLPAAALEGLGDGLARLQELSASLEHVLSCNPELETLSHRHMHDSER